MGGAWNRRPSAEKNQRPSHRQVCDALLHGRDQSHRGLA
jgi:hypothetical protein